MKLLKYFRDGLVEEEHSGYIEFLSKDNIKNVNCDKDIFFLRSCAKPLQASLLCDFGIVDELSLEQVAICCASHAGEEVHIRAVRSILEKYDIFEGLLNCGEHAPLSEVARNDLLLKGKTALQIHNNCSGKHAMMLLISKKMGWSLDNYYDLEHPLQKAIKQKINELCFVEKKYPITLDGCGVPIYSMPLINMLVGYLNLFCDEKYSRIKDAFITNPYIIGGENRLDTAIMIDDPHLIAKVGAGGLCIVLNIDEKAAILVKIADCDMRARAVCVIKCLRELGWIKKETEFLISQDKKNILTLSGIKVGEVCACFRFDKEKSIFVS